MRTLVVGAAIVDLMMKIDRLPKSGEDIPCRETKTVVGGCAYNVANTLRNLHCEHVCTGRNRIICRYYPQRNERKRIRTSD